MWCLIELKTEFELEQVISMQLRSKITVARNIRIHLHSLLKQCTNAVVVGLEVVKTTLN